MPTGTLVFNLPEDRQEHKFAIHGEDYACAINDFNEFLIFSFHKHDGVQHMTPEQVLEEIREEWRKRLEAVKEEGGRCW